MRGAVLLLISLVGCTWLQAAPANTVVKITTDAAGVGAAAARVGRDRYGPWQRCRQRQHYRHGYGCAFRQRGIRRCRFRSSPLGACALWPSQDLPDGGCGARPGAAEVGLRPLRCRYRSGN